MAKKKDFKSNPSMSFISQDTIDRVDGAAESPKAEPLTGRSKAPEGYKPDPRFIEKKSKRVQILMQPSLYAEAKAASTELGISLNDFIHRAISEATRNEAVRNIIEREI